jgi:acetyltransferase-like isoleucine patch superfamily enzyme
VATRLSAKLSAYCWDEPEPIRETFEELIGKPVGDSFHLIPPFSADYGLNITIGRAVFIGYECMFTGHGAIDIANEVMIANKVNLVTAGHLVDDSRRPSGDPCGGCAGDGHPASVAGIGFARHLGGRC